MSFELWNVIEHVIPASHIRGFHRGVRDESSAHLRLALKEYVPKSNPDPRPGDVTLIVAHGIGSAKECYEPFFDDLLRCDVRIRGIWAADATNNGASYILNEHILGDEPHWLDFSRDLIHMVNHFQTQMPPPIVGIGQSLGNVTILMMSIYHPRLFSGIVLSEPALGPGFIRTKRAQPHLFPSVLVAKRREKWPSREAARTSLAKSPYYGAFDSRVSDNVIEYELRNAPPDPLVDAERSLHPVILTVPKTMESYTWMRPDPPLTGFPEGPDYSTRSADSEVVRGFYRGEAAQVYKSLPHLYPAVLYIWGTLSPVSYPQIRQKYMRETGTGIGGNGGVAAGRVKEAHVTGARHPAPLEKPEGVAKALAPWLKAEMSRWAAEMEERKKEPGFYMAELHPEWLARLAKL